MLNKCKEYKKKQFKKLMKKMRQDPKNGLSLFYDEYAKMLTITSEVFCRSKVMAKEVVSEVLVKVWNLSKRNVEIDNPDGFIYVMTVNTAKDKMRKRQLLPLDEETVWTDGEIEKVIDEHSFYFKIKDLSETEQTIMIYKFVLLYTFDEIADELRKPLSTVTSAYYRALDKIKRKEEKS